MFYEGRREDLAFEKEHGSSANQRHHVRLWRVLDGGTEGRPVWLGSATFDRGVELSRYTGQITHRIAPDIDEERDTLVHDLSRAGMSKTIYQVTGIGPTLIGRNGEGDRYYTDGEIKIIVTLSFDETASEKPQMIPAPAAVALKDALWRKAKGALADQLSTALKRGSLAELRACYDGRPKGVQGAAHRRVRIRNGTALTPPQLVRSHGGPSAGLRWGVGRPKITLAATGLCRPFCGAGQSESLRPYPSGD